MCVTPLSPGVQAALHLPPGAPSSPSSPSILLGSPANRFQGHHRLLLWRQLLWQNRSGRSSLPWLKPLRQSMEGSCPATTGLGGALGTNTDGSQELARWERRPCDEMRTLPAPTWEHEEPCCGQAGHLGQMRGTAAWSLPPPAQSRPLDR